MYQANMETKICKECGKEHPLSNFKPTRWGTRAEVCNECVAIKRNENKLKQVGGG